MTSKLRRVGSWGTSEVASLAGVALLFVMTLTTAALAQPPLAPAAGDVPDAEADMMMEELTRGVVHEAYAQPVVFNPEAGEVVAEAPPDAIEELPPEEKPAGDNVEWIPGYWSWDDDENHYVWVSGLWRMVPPGLDWVPGYWTQTDGGYQWVSGFWRAEESDELEYLPEPPASIERGPAVDPPTPDHVWVSGSWSWMDTRYVWRPGYWVGCRPGWIWVPARHVWTPYGFIFVDGYWDYSLPRRGVMYAPIWFPRGYVVGHRYRYTPRAVIDVNVFSSHLFCRPTRGAYYFGDYYAASHFQRGVYPSYAYHMSRYGYDPVYAYRRWEHVKQQPDWHERMRAEYRHRRDHEEDRPPRTVHAAHDLAARGGQRDVQNLLLATSLTGLSKRPDAGFKVESLTRERRGQMQTELKRWTEIQDRRRDVEARHAHDDVKRGRPDDLKDKLGGRNGDGRGVVIAPGKGAPGDLKSGDRRGDGKGERTRDGAPSHKVRLFDESTHGRPSVVGAKPGDLRPGDVKPGDVRPGGGEGKPAIDDVRTRLTKPPRKVAAEFTPPPRPEAPKPDMKIREIPRVTTPPKPTGRGSVRDREVDDEALKIAPKDAPRGTDPNFKPPGDASSKRDGAPKVGLPKGRETPNSALEDARKANQKRVEDLQKQLKDRQQPATKRAEEAPRSINREKGNLDREKVDREKGEPKGGGRTKAEPKGGGTPMFNRPPSGAPRAPANPPRVEPAERDNKPSRGRPEPKPDRKEPKPDRREPKPDRKDPKPDRDKK